MRKAFFPKDGPLTDAGGEGGEQQATADLFAGAMSMFKNPASHRIVQFDDPWRPLRSSSLPTCSCASCTARSGGWTSQAEPSPSGRWSRTNFSAGSGKSDQNPP